MSSQQSAEQESHGSRVSRELGPAERTYFRDLLRNARQLAQGDQERFDGILFAIERLGFFLSTSNQPQQHNLGRYRATLLSLLGSGAYAELTEERLLVPNSRLITLVERGRNDALHQGAAARHLTERSIELSLRIEDALMSDESIAKVCDFMVMHPVLCETWQPLQFIRQVMLENSFSYLPVNIGQIDSPDWRLVHDFEVARFIGRRDFRQRKERLKMTLTEACRTSPPLTLVRAETVASDAAIDSVQNNQHPTLVFIGSGLSHPIGIITAFDLL